MSLPILVFWELLILLHIQFKFMVFMKSTDFWIELNSEELSMCLSILLWICYSVQEHSPYHKMKSTKLVAFSPYLAWTFLKAYLLFICIMRAYFVWVVFYFIRFIFFIMVIVAFISSTQLLWKEMCNCILVH